MFTADTMQFSELISQGRLKDCNENHREFGYRQEVNQIHIGQAHPAAGRTGMTDKGLDLLPGRSQQGLIPLEQWLGKKHGDKRTENEERAEGDVFIAFHQSQADQTQTYKRAGQRTDHNRQERGFPTQERPNHGQQLDVTAAHPLLAK